MTWEEAVEAEEVIKLDPDSTREDIREAHRLVMLCWLKEKAA